MTAYIVHGACFSFVVYQLLVATGFASGADAVDATADGVLFANVDQLVLCLGFSSSPLNHSAFENGSDLPEGQSHLVVDDCLHASTRWQRNLASLRTPSLIESWGIRQRVCLGLGPRITNSNRSAQLVLATGALCADAWHWHLDDEFRLRLQVRGSAQKCLEREASAQGSLVVLVDCSQSRAQQWLALPRGGPRDPNGRLDEIKFPLRSHGRHVVDAAGRVVRLRGVNWYGAHTESRVNNGLDKQPIGRIASLIRHLGFNHVRLNYAVEMWTQRREHPRVRPELVTANPHMRGLTELEAFDALVEAATSEGLLVIINSHTSDHRWCCGLDDDQGLWFNERFSTNDWLDSLTGLAKRYASNPRVIGFDARNEPRPNVLAKDAPWWDTHAWGGNCTDVALYSDGAPLVKLGSFSRKAICLPQFAADWREAATQAAYAIWHGNPEALVFIQGLGAAVLGPIRESPIAFKQECLHDRIVWSVHDYTWAVRFMRLGQFVMNGAKDIHSVFKTLTEVYRGSGIQEDWEDFVADRNASWAYLLLGKEAPLWVGEFGEASRSKWWLNFIRYAADMDLDWCYWSIDAYKYAPGIELDTSYMMEEQRFTVPGGTTTHHVPDEYGLLSLDYTGAREVWKLADVVSIQAPVLGEIVAIPRECVFDAALQPVGSVPLPPQGLHGFLDTNVTAFCSANATQEYRRLADATEPEAKSMYSVPIAEQHEFEEDPSGALGNNSDANQLAALAKRRSAVACGSLWQHQRGYLTESMRSTARSILVSNQLAEKPIVAVLGSPSPEVAQERLRVLLQQQVLSLRSFTTAITVGLFVVSVFVVIMYTIGMRTTTRAWRTPYESVKALLRCQRWIPPVGLTKAAAAMNAWRPLLAAVYLALVAGILASAAWGLYGSIRVNEGLATAKCAAMQGVADGLVGDSREGHSGDFVGLLPALSHISSLTSALSIRSRDWAVLRDLKHRVSEVPASMDHLRQVLSALANYSRNDCAAIGTTQVEAASRSAEWSWAGALAMLVDRSSGFSSKTNSILLAVRDKLARAREGVNLVSGFILKEFSFFYNTDPLAWASSKVQFALFLLMCVFLVVLIPMLAFSTWAVFLTFCHGKLPSLADWCPKRLFRRRPDDKKRFVNEVAVRPFAARMVWTTGVFLSVVALSLSTLLDGYIGLSANLCTVVDQLTGSKLHEYSAALGLPTDDHSLVGKATASLIAECFAMDGAAYNGNVLQIKTCPANILPSRIRTAVLNVTTVARNAFHKGMDLAERHPLSGNEDLVELAQRLADYSDYSVGNCSVLSKQRQLQELMSAGAEACRGDTSQDCMIFLGTSRGTDDASVSLEHASQALASIIRRRVTTVDEAVLNATSVLADSIMGDLNRDIFSHIIALTDSLDCAFLRRTIKATVDGVCFEGIIGLISVRDALFILGLLCATMSFVMYVLWVRLAHYRALAVEYYECARKASSGGTPMNLSRVSRRCAQGDTSVTGSSGTSVDSTQASPMESGTLDAIDCTLSAEQQPTEEMLESHSGHALVIGASSSPVLRRGVSQRSPGPVASQD